MRVLDFYDGLFPEDTQSHTGLNHAQCPSAWRRRK
jgi:hypothetical protein